MYFCKYDDVALKIAEKEKLFAHINTVNTFICELFPYFSCNSKGNIAKYARGKDYHEVVQNELAKRIKELKEVYPGNEFVSFCDNSPLPEVEIAYKSGAGILGKQGLIFDRKYGGYVFIGIIATDLILKEEAKNIEKCVECNVCVKACPSGALKNGDFSICISHQTQTNDEVSDEIIKKAEFIWGCDVCLDVCPMNREITSTFFEEFTQNLIFELKEEDILGLTRKQFKNKYPSRAFTFRGVAPILRNIKVRKSKEK